MTTTKPPTRKYSNVAKTLGECIEPVTRPVYRSRGLANIRLLTEWPKVVGSALANVSVPEKLSFAPGKTVDGTLTIAVAGGFATELQHMQPVILERINGYFGYKAVSRIAISHSFARPAPKVEKPQAKIALSAEAVATAGEITDPELKQAMESFAKTLQGN